MLSTVHFKDPRTLRLEVMTIEPKQILPTFKPWCISLRPTYCVSPTTIKIGPAVGSVGRGEGRVN